MSSSSSSSSSVSSSSRIEEVNNENPLLTGMHLGFQKLERRVIATTSTTRIIDIIGCDITIEDIQSVRQELINQKIDLKQDINKGQKFSTPHNYCKHWTVTPLIHFCRRGNLLIVRLLFLIGADCTQSCKDGYYFPMLAAAAGGHLDTCKWLFEYGGDAKYQINKETSDGHTPLRASYVEWRYYGYDKEGKTSRWLLRNGGGQHLSLTAMRYFIGIEGKEFTNTNFLVLWMRETIQLYDTFLLFLCGASIKIATSSSSSELNGGGTRTRERKRKRKIHRQRSLQILDGHPGIMELIADNVGIIREKEMRMLKEFNDLVNEYINTDESNGDDDDDNDNAEDY